MLIAGQKGKTLDIGVGAGFEKCLCQGACRNEAAAVTQRAQQGGEWALEFYNRLAPARVAEAVTRSCSNGNNAWQQDLEGGQGARMPLLNECRCVQLGSRQPGMYSEPSLAHQLQAGCWADWPAAATADAWYAV